MGLFNWVSNQFIEIIEWLDSSDDTLVWRFPHQNNEIKNGAKLVVREGQVAILIHEGQMGDVFQPGLYTLTTQNIPVLSSLKGWKYGFDSPFKCEVYFINTTQYLDMKWGTLSPITLRDADLGIVRLRAHGIYSIKIKPDQATTFFKEIVGTDGHVTTGEIEGQLRGMLVSSFTNAVGNMNVPFLDLAGQYRKIGEICKDEMEAEFTPYGVSLTKFIVQSVSLPPEVQAAMDQRASMGAIGNLNQYTQYQAANALREGAASGGGGGASGAMMDMAVGLSMGQMMSNSMGALAPPTQAPQAPVAAASPSVDSLADRLKKLKALLEGGLISDEVFAAKRDSILADI